MRKHRIIYLMGIMLILGLLSSGMAPKEKKEIKDYLGRPINELTKDIDHVIKKNGIKLKQDKDNHILEIELLDKDYQIGGISVGDRVQKIYEIYPEEWIIQDANHIWVGIGQENHYGIITEYIVFILDNKEIIQEIRLGYTTQFSKLDLPKSNQMTEKLLQGTWLSNKDRLLTFDKGKLQDNLMDHLWNEQYYQIVAPNEMFITRTKENQKEKLNINFWVNKENMYVFAIDDKGIPIEKSIEVFLKTN